MITHDCLAHDTSLIVHEGFHKLVLQFFYH